MSSRVKFYSVEDISTPRHRWVTVWYDRWWPTSDDGLVAVWVGGDGSETAICNSNPDIANGLKMDSLPGPAVFIPIAFTRHEC